MADKVVFDPQKLQSGSLVDCQSSSFWSCKKLCRIAAEECGENGFKGGIRPGNIYVAEDGRVKVGKAGKAGENGWTKLELEYMAPEVFWNGEESAAADVYAIALIMYAGTQRRQASVCRGRRAERREACACALRRRMSGDSFPMPEGVPDKLLAILKRALAFEPAKRYENSYEMLKALWEYRGDEPEEIKTCVKAPEFPEKPQPESEQPKPEPKPEPKNNRDRSLKKPGKKRERPGRTLYPKPQEPPKKDEAEPAFAEAERETFMKSARRRAVGKVTLAVITLLLVGVGFGRSSISFDVTPPAVQTQAPEPTAQPTTLPSAAPTETFPGRASAPAEVQYMLYSEDVQLG